MTPIELAKEARKQNRLERFGTNDPRCGVCGEANDCILEALCVVRSFETVGVRI